MLMNMRELVRMFVDESPLTQEEMDELLDCCLIKQIAANPRSYMLTEDGKKLLKS